MVTQAMKMKEYMREIERLVKIEVFSQKEGDVAKRIKDAASFTLEEKRILRSAQ